jgi:general L-amino acid transport system permease protein
MGKADTALAYVRTEEAPKLPAPPSTVGVPGWLLKNLFSSTFYSIVTVVLGAVMVWLIARNGSMVSIPSTSAGG